MAPGIRFTTSIGGISVPISGEETVSVTGEASQLAAPDIAPAEAGNLAVRTNGTSGSITMDDADHIITTGMRVDLYWLNTDGEEEQCYGATVGTVSGTTVPITAVAGGDALPPALTDITVCPAIAVDLPFDATDLKAMVASAGSARSYFVLHDGVYDLNPQYLSAGEVYYWHNEMGTTNPVDGESPTRVYISHADTSRTITNSKLAIVTGD